MNVFCIQPLYWKNSDRNNYGNLSFKYLDLTKWLKVDKPDPMYPRNKRVTFCREIGKLQVFCDIHAIDSCKSVIFSTISLSNVKLFTAEHQPLTK